MQTEGTVPPADTWSDWFTRQVRAAGLYGVWLPSFLVAGCVALVWYGCRDGWCEVRDLTRKPESV